MGALRIILATSVVYGHAGDFFGFPLIPGDTAVQAFYAVSGFYMALVLNEKYRTGYFLFISNRFVRLFPAYAIVVLLTVSLAIVMLNLPSSSELPFVSQWRSLRMVDWPAAAFLIVSQTIMLGQDLYLFLTLKGGALAFWPDFKTAAQPVYTWLIVPQAWTLGVEFSFYLVAPFILRRSTHVIAAVLAASLALRLFLQFGVGYFGDPWSYRFFPSELAVFLFGALGYRFYRSQSTATECSQLATFVVALVCLGAVLLINRWHGLSRVASVAALMVAIAAIPFLFRLTKDQAIDRNLGELSYPIYICHYLVIWFLDSVVVFSSSLTRGCAIVASTVIVSVGLLWFVDRPIDKWRHRRFVHNVAVARPASEQ